MFAQKTAFSRLAMARTQMRFFGVDAKLPKIELTMRTPYKTLFKDFAGFEHIQISTVEGEMALVNNTPPRIHFIPAGELTLVGMSDGEGNKTKSTTGKFIHTGGWVFIHP